MANLNSEKRIYVRLLEKKTFYGIDSRISFRHVPMLYIFSRQIKCFRQSKNADLNWDKFATDISKLGGKLEIQEPILPNFVFLCFPIFSVKLECL